MVGNGGIGYIGGSAGGSGGGPGGGPTHRIGGGGAAGSARENRQHGGKKVQINQKDLDKFVEKRNLLLTKLQRSPSPSIPAIQQLISTDPTVPLITRQELATFTNSNQGFQKLSSVQQTQLGQLLTNVRSESYFNYVDFGDLDRGELNGYGVRCFENGSSISGRFSNGLLNEIFGGQVVLAVPEDGKGLVEEFQLDDPSLSKVEIRRMRRIKDELDQPTDRWVCELKFSNSTHSSGKIRSLNMLRADIQLGENGEVLIVQGSALATLPDSSTQLFDVKNNCIDGPIWTKRQGKQHKEEIGARGKPDCYYFQGLKCSRKDFESKNNERASRETKEMDRKTSKSVTHVLDDKLALEQRLKGRAAAEQTEGMFSSRRVPKTYLQGEAAPGAQDDDIDSSTLHSATVAERRYFEQITRQVPQVNIAHNFPTSRDVMDYLTHEQLKNFGPEGADRYLGFIKKGLSPKQAADAVELTQRPDERKE